MSETSTHEHPAPVVRLDDLTLTEQAHGRHFSAAMGAIAGTPRRNAPRRATG